ncbi:PREDICTED: uncharacterized protein LOC108445781 [Corvus brachyrhynchos]|uniref:uncharacterized protein LOC108445781 n=1 Tax=Corvus brachyrhynchos TaxID=85066 RepID=UPI0008166E8B|nr:PREDICTED: uncharacterized protein LOC108445781 [Corvus brachyrhynchos]XP_017586062.1 PREDICTED: uncharacterized protein LOC108445781 [Corvus brachyrhynchos]
MLVEFIVSLWFEVLMSIWSLGLFAYPQIGPFFSLVRNFYRVGAQIQISILLCSVIMVYRKLTEVLEVVENMHGLLFLHPNPSPTFSSLFWGFISNCIQFVRGGGGDGVSLPFISFPLKFDTSPFENVQFPLDVRETTFLVFYLVGFLYMVCSLSRMRDEISRVADETPDPGVENPEWCGEWEDMGQALKEFSDSIAWNFPPEQMQNPAEVGKYLKEKCNDKSNEKKLIAICRALAYAYHTLQQVKVEGQEDKSADTSVTQAAAKPDCEPKPSTVVPTMRKKHTTKTNRPVKDDDAG